MSAVNADAAEAWRVLAVKVAEQRPDTGKRVRVTSGKHAGVEGVVVKHARSKFKSDRYVSEASRHLRDLVGREGFAVRVLPDGGGERFWVNAEKVEVLK